MRSRYERKSILLSNLDGFAAFILKPQSTLQGSLGAALNRLILATRRVGDTEKYGPILPPVPWRPSNGKAYLMVVATGFLLVYCRWSIGARHSIDVDCLIKSFVESYTTMENGRRTYGAQILHVTGEMNGKYLGSRGCRTSASKQDIRFCPPDSV